jgi:hypothetical protein
MAGRRVNRGWIVALPLALAACMNAIPPGKAPPPQPPGTRHPPAPRPTRRPAPAPAPTPTPPPFRPPTVERVPGVEGLIQQSAAGLIAQFGPPRLDVREGDMRKLQFTGQACVLDVFLYPLRQGGEPVATYVEARRASDGQDVDKPACVAALLKR